MSVLEMTKLSKQDVLTRWRALYVSFAWRKCVRISVIDFQEVNAGVVR